MFTPIQYIEDSAQSSVRPIESVSDEVIEGGEGPGHMQVSYIESLNQTLVSSFAPWGVKWYSVSSGVWTEDGSLDLSSGGLNSVMIQTSDEGERPTMILHTPDTPNFLEIRVWSGSNWVIEQTISIEDISGMTESDKAEIHLGQICGDRIIFEINIGNVDTDFKLASVKRSSGVWSEEAISPLRTGGVSAYKLSQTRAMDIYGNTYTLNGSVWDYSTSMQLPGGDKMSEFSYPYVAAFDYPSVVKVYDVSTGSAILDHTFPATPLAFSRRTFHSNMLRSFDGYAFCIITYSGNDEFCDYHVYHRVEGVWQLSHTAPVNGWDVGIGIAFTEMWLNSTEKRPIITISYYPQSTITIEEFAMSHKN